MTVPCEFTLYDYEQTRADGLAKKIYASTKELEKKYNFHAPNSWLNTVVNNRQQNCVQCPEEFAAVLRQVRSLNQRTRGLFDITVGTLSYAARMNPSVDKASLIEQLASSMGGDSWSLQGRQLIFSQSQTRFDLGGVIKEYAVDQAAIIASSAAGGSLVNFGGDIRVQGRKPDGERIRIGIKNPKDPEQLLLSIGVEDVAVTTSGGYERSIDIGGGSHSHILSGSEVSNQNVLSTTVIASTALEAGAYATSLMLDKLLTPPEGVQLILIDDNLKIYSNVQPDA